MGFQRKAYKLVWPDESRWAGLEVRVRGMSIEELDEVSSLNAQAGGKTGPLLDILETAILSWNFEDEDGNPVPVENFRKEDATMLLAIVSAWTEVVGDVPTPLPMNSSDGEKSAEALIPMEIPSSSHPSLSMPN